MPVSTTSRTPAATGPHLRRHLSSASRLVARHARRCDTAVPMSVVATVLHLHAARARAARSAAFRRAAAAARPRRHDLHAGVHGRATRPRHGGASRNYDARRQVRARLWRTAFRVFFSASPVTDYHHHELGFLLSRRDPPRGRIGARRRIIDSRAVDLAAQVDDDEPRCTSIAACVTSRGERRPSRARWACRASGRALVQDGLRARRCPPSRCAGWSPSVTARRGLPKLDTRVRRRPPGPTTGHAGISGSAPARAQPARSLRRPARSARAPSTHTKAGRWPASTPPDDRRLRHLRLRRAARLAWQCTARLARAQPPSKEAHSRCDARTQALFPATPTPWRRTTNPSYVWRAHQQHGPDRVPRRRALGDAYKRHRVRRSRLPRIRSSRAQRL